MIWVALLSAGVSAGWLLGTGQMEHNMEEAGMWWPRGGLLSLQGVTLGLCGRDRVRLGRGFCSPSLAWLAKKLLFGSSILVAIFCFAPVAWPAACLDLFAAANAVGWAVWLANLPPRL